MKRKINKTFWAVAIVGLLTLSSVFFMQTSAKTYSRIIENGNSNGQDIPVIGRFVILIRPNRVINVEIDNSHFSIESWTELDQTVRIEWEYENQIDKQRNVKIGWRIAEWQDFFPRFLFFFTRTGNIYTHGENGNQWMNTKTIVCEKNTKGLGYIDVNVSFYEKNPYNDMTAFLMSYFPLNGAYSSIKVRF